MIKIKNNKIFNYLADRLIKWIEEDPLHEEQFIQWFFELVQAEGNSHEEERAFNKIIDQLNKLGIYKVKYGSNKKDRE